MGTGACGRERNLVGRRGILGFVSFAAASAITALSPNRYRADIPDGWQQGRAAFGGLVLGTLLRAIEATEATEAASAGGSRPRSTRTLTGDLCGPVVPGPVEISVRTLRRGNNQSNLAAELTQNGALLATATA